MKKMCKYCNHCKCVGRANETRNSRTGWSRKEYMCKHPEINNMPLSAFGSRMPGFIGFGDCTSESPVQIKTAPKWCPEKEGQK